MWAIMPILRISSRGKALVTFFSPAAGVLTLTLLLIVNLLPSVVSKGPVGLGHSMRIFPFLNGGALSLESFGEFIGQFFGHGLAFPGLGRLYQPGQRQEKSALRLDFHRHLVGRAADTPGLDLEQRRDIFNRLFQRRDRVFRYLLSQLLEGAVNDALAGPLLTALHDFHDQPGHGYAAVPGIGTDFPLY